MEEVRKTKYGTVMSSDTRLSSFLREERDKRGLSQQEFSELSGVSLPMISYIENGKRAGRRTLQKISKALEVDYLYLREINGNIEKI